MSQLKLSKDSWSTQSVFIMAAVGSAVGLGNLWKFPYITGEYGGGAFVLVYLLCIVLLGIPVLFSEFVLGRHGKANPVQAMANVARENNASRAWGLLGFNGVLAGLLILSFYSVIAGWALYFLIESVKGSFVDSNAAQIELLFSGLLSSPGELMFWHTLFALATVYIVAKGVKSGIEKAINFLMPGLLFILLILLGYATTTGFLGQSFHFLFDADFSKLTWEAVLVALGHAFFTLSIGMGAMMVYASYVPQENSIVKAGLWIALADTAIALIAGLVIFAIVFANDLAPGSGPGLLFQTLPIAFGDMTGGWLFGSLFFALVVMAALSSSISLIEPAVSWFEQNWGLSRAKAAWILGGIVWVVGIGTVLSFNVWAEKPLVAGKTFFDSLDFLTSNIMLPLGGLLMAVFVAWVLKREVLQNELQLKEQIFTVLLLIMKWVTPIAVIVVFASNLVAREYFIPVVGALFALYILYVMYRSRLNARHNV